MKEAGRDSSGKYPYISDPESILNVLTRLSGLGRDYLTTSEKKDAAQARQIATLLLVNNLGASYQETGNFFCGLTGPTIRKYLERGARSMVNDEDFAHTFAIAETSSNIAQKAI